MSKAKRVFEESLAKLEADFNRQKEAVKLRDKEIEKLSRELKVMPLHLKAQLVRTIQQRKQPKFTVSIFCFRADKASTSRRCQHDRAWTQSKSCSTDASGSCW